jgi:hypothetical protein
MKIFCVSLGRNGTQSLTEFIKKQGYTATHFYRFDKIDPGTFTEDANGIVDHFYSLVETDAHVDIPTSLVFDRMYEKFPDAKFINITRPAEDWLASMQKMNRLMGHDHDPYIFEEAYCNFYFKTGKKKIQDLTEDELLAIREAHLNKINEFFKDKENYLEVELSDPEISSKLKLFIDGNSDALFPNYDGFRSSDLN